MEDTTLPDSDTTLSDYFRDADFAAESLLAFRIDAQGALIDALRALFYGPAGLVRLRLGAPWLESGALVKLFTRSVPSPHAHYLCWQTGTMDRWECAAFADWLKKAMA